MPQPITSRDGWRRLARHDVAADQIDQMRQHRAAGGPAQRRDEADIEALDDRVYGFAPRFEALDDAGFPLPPMRHKGANLSLRLPDRRTWRRPRDPVRARQQLVDR